MFDHKHRRPYWLETRRLMLFALLPCLVLLFGVMIFRSALDAMSFIGFPLGYFLLAHGFIILGFVAFIWHGNKQDQIDHRHGTHEDT